MITKRAWIAVGVCICLLGTGCGKNDEAPEQFNKVLGDSAVGAPVSPGTADLGILQNPSSYTGTAGAIGSSAAENAEAAARELMQTVVEAGFNLDFFTILDAYDPNYLGPMADQDLQESAAAAFEKLDSLRTLWNERIADQEVADMRELWNRLTAQLNEQAILELLTYEVAGEDTVIVRFDETRASVLRDDLTQIVGEAVGLNTPLTNFRGIGPLMGIGDPRITDPNRVSEVSETGAAESRNEVAVATRIDGRWLLRPAGPTLTEDQAAMETQGMQMALLLVQGLLDGIYRVIEEADAGILNSPQMLVAELMAAAQEGGGGAMPSDFEDSFGDTDDGFGDVPGDALQLTADNLREADGELIASFMAAAENDDLELLESETFQCTFTCAQRDSWALDDDGLGTGDVSLHIEKSEYDEAANSVTLSLIIDADVTRQRGRPSGRILALEFTLEDVMDMQREILTDGFESGRLRFTGTFRPVSVRYEDSAGVTRAVFVVECSDFSLRG